VCKCESVCEYVNESGCECVKFVAETMGVSVKWK